MSNLLCSVALILGHLNIFLSSTFMISHHRELECPYHGHIHYILTIQSRVLCTVKRLSRNRPEQAKGNPGRLRPRIFVTFGTTRVVNCQLYAPAAFTPGEISGTHFQGLSRTQGTWFRLGGTTEKKIPRDTIRDRPTSSAVP